MFDNVVGIDVSQAKCDVYLLSGERGRHRCVANSPTGFANLLGWLETQEVLPALVCMEATGTYHVALARALWEAGLRVSVVNPSCIKAYADASLSRTKTDKVDARLIARYAQSEGSRLTLWEPLAPEVAQLQGVLKRLEDVVKMLTQESNRLAAPEQPEAVRTSCERVRTLLLEEQQRLLAELDAHVEAHPNLRAQRELLVSIPGVGAKTAAFLVGVLSSRPFQRARQVGAFAGLTPRERVSGSSVRGKPRISKRGHANIRLALYWPAVSAMRCNPLMQPFVTRMLAEGRPKMQIIVAVMRKLLHQAFGILKHGQPFDAHHQPQISSIRA